MLVSPAWQLVLAVCWNVYEWDCYLLKSGTLFFGLAGLERSCLELRTIYHILCRFISFCSVIPCFSVTQNKHNSLVWCVIAVISWLSPGKTCYEPCCFDTGCKMNLVMAEKDQPVFRDFLGLGRIDDISQVKYLSSEVIPPPRTSPGFESEYDAETDNTRASSGISGRFKTNSTPIHVSPPFYSAIPSSSDPGSGIVRGSPSTFSMNTVVFPSLFVCFSLTKVEFPACSLGD